MNKIITLILDVLSFRCQPTLVLYKDIHFLVSSNLQLQGTLITSIH